MKLVHITYVDVGLNALTGINRILTRSDLSVQWWIDSLNALTGINRILTRRPGRAVRQQRHGLNALTGINRILTGERVVELKLDNRSQCPYGH